MHGYKLQHMRVQYFLKKYLLLLLFNFFLSQNLMHSKNSIPFEKFIFLLVIIINNCLNKEAHLKNNTSWNIMNIFIFEFGCAVILQPREFFNIKKGICKLLVFCYWDGERIHHRLNYNLPLSNIYFRVHLLFVREASTRPFNSWKITILTTKTSTRSNIVAYLMHSDCLRSERSFLKRLNDLYKMESWGHFDGVRKDFWQTLKNMSNKIFES